MTTLQTATKQYNKIMNAIGREHLTVGTSLSEGTEHYGIKEMLQECKEQLATYTEWGHCNYDLKQENRKTWISETGKLKRFIQKYDHK